MDTVYAFLPINQVYLLTLKVVSESCVTWATSVLLVFLGLSVLDLGPTYTTDPRQTSNRRQTDVRQHHHFMLPTIRSGHKNLLVHGPS